jgi:hypothetical protein
MTPLLGTIEIQLIWKQGDMLENGIYRQEFEVLSITVDWFGVYLDLKGFSDVCCLFNCFF